MTNKVDIRRLDSTTINDTAATALINENFEALQTAIENTLSRDGTTPNFMDADLDLNSYKIINAGDPENDHDVITKGWFDQFVEDASTAASDANAAAARAASSAQTASISAQNAEASASAALDDASLAKDWATKMDGTVDGVDYSSKYYALQITPIATDILTVAGIASDVTTVAGIASDVTDVADIKNDVTTVSGIASDVTAVKNNATDISAVAANETNINTVAGDSTSINAVAGDLTNIDAVAADLTNINNASTYAAEAKQWAIGDPTEPIGNSAKYWADQAAQQAIPSQAGHSGEYLTTDGSDLSWNAVDALPDQTGQSGKFLTTDGTDASWTTVSITVDQVYDSASANAQSGVAIDGAGFLNNTASGSNSLSILGSVIAAGSATAVGVGSDAGANGVSLGRSASSGNGGLALGTYAKANGSWATAVGNGNSNLNNAVASGSGSIAIGHNAQATASDAIQIGEGINSTADSLQVESYSLLDTSTGIIPYQRINAITDSNSGGQLKVWHGTQAEYDALATHDANTRYYTDGGLSVSLLDLIYPVGSIYITTNSSCPLSTLITGSTWTLVGQDKVLQGAGTRGIVGTTLNESLPNITSGTNWFMTVGGTTSKPTTTSFSASGATTAPVGSAVQGHNGNNAGFPWTRFDASLQSSTYQDDAPVQPDAYLVNIFERTA